MRAALLLTCTLFAPTIGAQATVTTTAQQIHAAENLVYRSAFLQGRLSSLPPGISQSKNSEDILDSALDVAAIAQKLAQDKAGDIHANLKADPARYTTLAYRYAKYSGCPVSVKNQILQSIIEGPPCECDPLIPALAAFELLKDKTAADTTTTAKAATVLTVTLQKYKVAEVSLNRYWKLLGEINEEAAGNAVFAQIITAHFPSDLKSDIKKARSEIRPEPSTYGASLYTSEMYNGIPQNIRGFWCNKWGCAEH